MARSARAFVALVAIGWIGGWLTNGPVAPDPHPVVLRAPATTTTIAPTTTTTEPSHPPVSPPPRASRGQTRRIPPTPAPVPVWAEIDGMPGMLRRIGGCESAGHPEAPINWTAQNRHSSASGGFQIIDSTWAGWVKAYAPDLVGMYAKARMAPPSDQLRVARAAFERQGTGPWAASRHCWS